MNDKCLVCKAVFETPDTDRPHTLDTVVFIHSEPLPSQMIDPAYNLAYDAIVHQAFTKVKFHVECAFGIRGYPRPAVTGPRLRLVKCPA